MKKISTILIESQKTRKQTTGDLVKREDRWTMTEEEFRSQKPESYCALGAIACELGLIKTMGDKQALPYRKILRTAEIDDNLIIAEYTCPICSSTRYGLDELIWHMNDRHESTFEHIGKHLRSIGF